MLNALLWGFAANASLILGGFLGLNFTFSKRSLGIIMAFGAGTLISAVSYELMLDSAKISRGAGVTALAFFFGAAVFFAFDKVIEIFGAKERKAIGATQSSALAAPLVLAIILDGIPESTVIGLGLLQGGTVSVAMLIAVFVSNLPEAIASTTGMKAGAWSPVKIMLLWVSIAVVCACASATGYALLGNASELWVAFIKAFAAGAILMMLANTMMPEAFNHGGKLAGVFTVMGFALSMGLVLLEHL